MNRHSIARLAGIAGLVLTAAAWAQPTTVYVYNGGANNQGSHDGFNSGCQGWIFQAMGLLGPNGEPPRVDGDQLKKPDGTVCGSVIRDANNNIIGYRNADGTKEAYNVDTSATTSQAWQRVDANGQLVIAKHGVRYVNGRGETTGTGTTLDGGRSYPGFKPEGGAGGGTGAPGTPYPLPPRPGASVDVYLNGCYTTHDADGDGPGKSVGGSIEDVPGVDDENVTGNEDLIYKGPGIGITAENQETVDAAAAALEDCARAAGFTKTVENPDGTQSTVGDPGAWIAQLPFNQQYSAIQECLRTHRVRGATASIDYQKSTSACGDDGCAYYEPVTVFGPEGGLFHYQASPERPFIDLAIPPGAIPPGTDPVPVYVRPTALSDGLPALPPGMALGSMLANVGRYDHQPLQLAAPAMLAMSFPAGGPVVGVFRAAGDGWEPYPASVEPLEGFLVTQVQQGGVFALLVEAPPVECRADFNADGVANSQDFFDFLGAFFGGRPEADFNADGVTNSQDFFDFVTAFFEGCP